MASTSFKPGVIRVAPIRMYTVDDVMVLVGCCRTSAQDIIRRYQQELVDQGYERPPKGRIQTKYFNEKYFGSDDLVEGVAANG